MERDRRPAWYCACGRASRSAAEHDEHLAARKHGRCHTKQVTRALTDADVDAMELEHAKCVRFILEQRAQQDPEARRAARRRHVELLAHLLPKARTRRGRPASRGERS